MWFIIIAETDTNKLLVKTAEPPVPGTSKFSPTNGGLGDRFPPTTDSIPLPVST